MSISISNREVIVVDNDNVGGPRDREMVRTNDVAGQERRPQVSISLTRHKSDQCGAIDNLACHDGKAVPNKQPVPWNVQNSHHVKEGD